MKDEYDFTDAEQGRFYRPIEALEIPVYLDKENRDFLMKKVKKHGKNFSLTHVVNALIRQDIEITKHIAL